MEPANLKPDSTDDAQVEAWLRANATAAPLPDDGFSERVLTALPAAQPAAPARPAWGGWLYAAAAVLGVLAASRSGGGGTRELRAQLADLVPAAQAATAPFADPSVLIGLIVTALSLAFVYRRELLARLVAK